MAQRTSAVCCIALVALVASVVSGCGGGSSSSATGTTSAAAPAAGANGGSSTTADAQGKNQKQPDSQHRASQKQTAPKKTKKTDTSGASTASTESASGKHGSKVVLPEGPPEPEPTAQEEEETTFVEMSVSSPAIDSSGAFSKTYTCDGKGISPPIEWQGVPGDTNELAVIVTNFAPVEGKLFFDWAVAGISPEATGLEAGKVPAGAVVGKNSEGKVGYSLCPEGPSGETYVITVYALGKAAGAKQGFDPAAFRERAQELSKTAGLLSFSYSG